MHSFFLARRQPEVDHTLTVVCTRLLLSKLAQSRFSSRHEQAEGGFYGSPRRLAVAHSLLPKARRWCVHPKPNDCYWLLKVGCDHSQAGVLVPAGSLVVLGFIHFNHHNVRSEVKGKVRPLH
jgi:hypothetical protein